MLSLCTIPLPVGGDTWTCTLHVRRAQGFIKLHVSRLSQGPGFEQSLEISSKSGVNKMNNLKIYAEYIANCRLNDISIKDIFIVYICNFYVEILIDETVLLVPNQTNRGNDRIIFGFLPRLEVNKHVHRYNGICLFIPYAHFYILHTNNEINKCCLQ